MISRQVLNVLPLKIREVIDGERALSDLQVEEIRLRAGKQVLLISGKEEVILKVTVNEMMIREAMEYISGYSLYAYEEQLREGFITIRGGHRVGIAGKTVLEQEKVKTIKNISSINIRISHQIIGCSDGIMKYVKGNILIMSPPRMGKTTLLRDILRNLGNMKNQNIAIVDERSEIAACYNGIPQNDIGERCDVLDCCPKALGMLILLRTMSPTYIAVDELASKEDVKSVLGITGAGTYIAATVHGESMEEISRRRYICELFDRKIFDTYIELSGSEISILNKSMEKVFEGKR